MHPTNGRRAAAMMPSPRQDTSAEQEAKQTRRAAREEELRACMAEIQGVLQRYDAQLHVLRIVTHDDVAQRQQTQFRVDVVNAS